MKPFEDLVGAPIASALVKRGFTALMPVQEAMLAPELAGRDLRVSSQTGSGKTVAIGLAIRALAEGPAPAANGAARPRALVVVPTRELAKQVDEELSWLYAPLHTRVASVIGGSSFRDERRAFAAGPAVVVGTPGRLLDHLNRGSIDPSGLAAVVLDEADRMLDLGFREDLEAILKHAPEDHQTHLVSATFPRDVLSLANRVQKDPAHIEGTPLGTANADIDHLIHLVAQHERVAAIINLLLSTPGAQTLVFARTRADVAQITAELGEAGFDVRALSGEMEQGERNRALAAFKRGNLHALVATDVAARGIDVQDIVRVIHAEAPTDADSYTHRSGRTGRAGKKGTSSVMSSPAGLARVVQLLRRAGVKYRLAPIPTAAELRQAADERILAELTAEGAGDESESPVEPRLAAIAERLASTGDVAKTIARLLARSHVATGPQPRDVRVIAPPDRERPAHLAGRPARPQFDAPDRPARDHRGAPERPARERHDGPERPPRDTSHGDRGPSERGPREAREPRAARDGQEWVPFRFTWGQEHGADPRRLLAMACRRGGIQATDIGVIHVARTHSIVNVASGVAVAFARSAAEHDPRDPRVTIRADVPGSREPHETQSAPPPRPQAPPHAAPHAPPRPPPHAPRSHASAPAPRPHAPKPHAPAHAQKAPAPRAHGAKGHERHERHEAERPAPKPHGPRRHVTHERPKPGGEARPKRRP